MQFHNKVVTEKQGISAEDRLLLTSQARKGHMSLLVLLQVYRKLNLSLSKVVVSGRYQLSSIADFADSAGPWYDLLPDPNKIIGRFPHRPEATASARLARTFSEV